MSETPATYDAPPGIQLDELPAHLRALADDIMRVGGAVRYYGGFGAFGQWGAHLCTLTGPMCAEIADQLEKMRGGHA